ncbi:uncharacterized protein [Procambarus clarkii]|uniref:uncharacterized protein n=1 Tax=Procambarus clarkii TaxID=6728 RepID=UPI003743390B
MVEPAGAMAMFVLRLAGLLSLENALKEQEANLTHAHLNLTGMGFTPDTSNFTWSSTQYLSHVSPLTTSNPRTGEVAAPTTLNPWAGEVASPTTANPRAGAVASPTTSNPWTGEVASPTTANPRAGEVASPTTANPRTGEVAAPTTLNPWAGEVASPTTANPRAGAVASPTTSNPWTGEVASPTTANPRAGEVASPTTANPRAGEVASPTTSNPRAGEVASPTTANPRAGEVASPTTSNPWTGDVASPTTANPRAGEVSSPTTSNPRTGEATAPVTPSYPATTSSTSVGNLPRSAPTLTSHSTIDSFILPRINELPVNHSQVLASVTSYIGNAHSSTDKNSLPDESDNTNFKMANDSIEMLPRASPLSDVRDNVNGNDDHGPHSLHNAASQIKQGKEEPERLDHRELIVQKVHGGVTGDGDEGSGEDHEERLTPGRGLEPQGRGTEAQGRDTEPQEKGTEPQEKIAEPQEKVAEPQGRGTESQGRGTESQGRGTESQGRGTESQGRGTESQGRGTESQGRGTESQRRGTESRGRSTESQKRGTESQRRGTESQGRGTESQRRGTKVPAVVRTRIRKGKGKTRNKTVSSNPGRGESLPVDVGTGSHIDPSTTPPTLAAPISSPRSRLRLEALVEDDDVSALIDAPRLVDLEAPSEGFVESSFEYYDFGSQKQLVTAKPTLSSLSLVSAVPVRPPSRPPEPRREHRVIKPAPARPRKVPPARPIPPVRPQQPVARNNPYPYGPKLLPGPFAPLTSNLPPVRENSEERVATEYNYEEDLDYYYDPGNNEESRYEVQTKEPSVLFVFDKPGYSPEAPTTMGPPTRAPTPSDPWDCAPRCPRYTLLDWSMDYDVRLYPETLWVSTVMISDNRVLAELEGYMRVQDYFYGLNDQGMVLNLTVPFVTQIKFGKHPGVLEETNDYTVSLYVQPTYYQYGDLPTPISNEVLVDELEAKTVFVHSFEANVWDVTENFLQEKVQTLMEQLRHNGEAFLDRYYYLASYSRPELYQAVYYEIWIYATNFRDPQTHTRSSQYNRRPQTNKITQKTLNKLCRGVECPKFEVLRTYKYGIQKRRYYHGLFASTSPRECQFTTMSVWKGFMPLHLYKHGVNSHMEVIEATRPIALVHIRDSTDPNTECPQNLTMSLYLPQRLHSNPPITGYAAPSVHITDLDDVIVYAYTVGGYLLDPIRVRKELSDMKYRLSEFGACYKDDEHYVVIYDFIVRYHGRQNEIWIVAENCKATHNG